MSRALIFQVAPGLRLQLGAAVMTTLARFEQHSEVEPEAGGVLLGRWLRDGSAVIVDEVTTPGGTDEAGRYTFHRSHEHHQRLTDEAWERSGGTCVYLGEWHTHAEPDPTPSRIDLDDWQRRLREDDVEADLRFFAIVGTEVTRLWVGDRRTGTIVKTPLMGSSCPGIEVAPGAYSGCTAPARGGTDCPACGVA